MCSWKRVISKINSSRSFSIRVAPFNWLPRCHRLMIYSYSDDCVPPLFNCRNRKPIFSSAPASRHAPFSSVTMNPDFSDDYQHRHSRAPAFVRARPAASDRFNLIDNGSRASVETLLAGRASGTGSLISLVAQLSPSKNGARSSWVLEHSCGISSLFIFLC